MVKYEPVNSGKKKPAQNEQVEEISEADESNSDYDMTPIKTRENPPPPKPAKPQNQSFVRKGTGADFALPKARKFELKPPKKIEEATKLSETSEKSGKLKIFNQIKRKSQASTSPVSQPLKKQKSSTKETKEVFANPKRGFGRKERGFADFKNAAKKSITFDANAIQDILEEEGEEDHSLLSNELESPILPPKKRADQQQANKAGNYGFEIELIAEESESGTMKSSVVFTNSSASEPKPTPPPLPKPFQAQKPMLRRKNTGPTHLKPMPRIQEAPPKNFQDQKTKTNIINQKSPKSYSSNSEIPIEYEQTVDGPGQVLGGPRGDLSVGVKVSQSL